MTKHAKKQKHQEAITRLTMHLRELTDMALSDRIAFMEAVLDSPQPTEPAIDAAKRYRKSFMV